MKKLIIILVIILISIVGGFYMNYRNMGHKDGPNSCIALAQEQISLINKILSIRSEVIYDNDSNRTVNFYGIFGNKLTPIELHKSPCNHFVN